MGVLQPLTDICGKYAEPELKLILIILGHNNESQKLTWINV